MRALALVVLSFLASSCVVHVHVHEAQRAPDVAPPVPHEIARDSAKPNDTFRSSVRGLVVDAEGRPVRARVALVAPNGGSTASTTDDGGRFAMLTPRPGTSFVAHASTDDGLVAVRSIDAGEDDVRLVLAPGGAITVEYTGEEHMRCAVFQGDLRIEDFTVRPPTHRSRVAVPTGEVRVRVYGGGTSPSGGPAVTYDDRVTIAPGETKPLNFAVSMNAF